MIRQLIRRVKAWWTTRRLRGERGWELEEPQVMHRGQAPQGGFYFEDARDQLDANEFFEAEQSRTTRSVEIEDIAEWTRLSEHSRRLTAQGLVTEEGQILLRTTTGQIVTPEQLYGGGKCWVCGGYCDREHFYLCTVCGRGLCHLHVYAVDGFPLCPPHARQALYNFDTWSRRDSRHGHR